jgi:gliding motility-associated-like protein
MKRFFVIVLLAFNYLILSATHNRAGEITYTQLSDLTYRFTITTFTYTLSLADRPSLDVHWGDNSVSTASRVEKTKLPNYYQKNTYIADHTFPGPGVYKVVVWDPNRNLGVLNIPNSVNVVFSVSTILTVNPNMGYNSTPVLLNPPYDKAALGYIFIHNPAAYDPDGDSLSYKLTVCTREEGKPIENYTLPPATHYIRVDSISGDLIWDTPADTGKYNVAMEIQEWRNGKKIGVVVRDMQIEVFETNNKPPVNGPLYNLCKEVGDTIDFIVSATDENNDMISLKATSGIFTLNKCQARFTGVDSVPGRSSSRFRWIPCYEAVREQPYNIIFKSDDHNEELMLSDIDNMSIKILGPKPEIDKAVPEGKYIRVTWQPYGTDAIAGFNIYRREGPTTYMPDSCTAGIPQIIGFIKAGYISGSNTVTYIDTDNEQGLQFGKEYTYRVVAVYKNGTESKPSDEVTTSLVSGVPVITNVSVIKTDQTNGVIYLAWRKPDLDTVPNADGPYEYNIYRAHGISSNDFTLIDSIAPTDLNDTVYFDTLDTESSGYLYKIELNNRTPGHEFTIGEPGIASSLFLSANPGDRKVRFTINRNVPWINSRYDFFKLDNATMNFDSIGSTNQLTFVDYSLINGEDYCYYVRSSGDYSAENMPKNLINLSQIACATPVDNEPPCPPDISVTTNCDSLSNTVRWSIDDPVCFDDVAGYYIYYQMTIDGDLSLIMTINDKNIMQYTHKPGDIVSGCYAVSAFDQLYNEGDISEIICVVDSCNFYEIPNVFTPNNDGINDRLIAKTSPLVDHVDFKLFNRNGLLIFSTNEPRLNWDGTYKDKIVSPGVYFYRCDVFENGIKGLKESHLSGFIHVITEAGAKVPRQETK